MTQILRKFATKQDSCDELQKYDDLTALFMERDCLEIAEFADLMGDFEVEFEITIKVFEISLLNLPPHALCAGFNEILQKQSVKRVDFALFAESSKRFSVKMR